MTQNPLPLKTISAAGVSALVRHGDRSKPVVFLHGLGSRASSFTPMFEAWDPGPRLIAWDMPGYGSSAPLAQSWPNASDYADRLAAFLDFEAPHVSIDLVGHSLGCSIAMAFARIHPARVRTLSLSAPALGYAIAPGTALTPQLQGRIDDINTLGPERMAHLRAPRMLPDSDRTPAHAEKLIATMASLNPAGYTQAVHMLASADLLVDATHITCPVRVHACTNDAITPSDGAERLATALKQKNPNATVITRTNGGHAAYLFDPAGFGQALRNNFMRS